MRLSRSRWAAMLTLGLALGLGAATAEARIVFDVNDPAFQPPHALPIDPSTGFVTGMMHHVVERDGVEFTFDTANPHGFTQCGGDACLFAAWGPQGVVIRMEPPVPALGLFFDGADGCILAEFVGSAGTERFTGPPAPTFVGAADIGPISELRLNQCFGVTFWREIHFATGSTPPPPPDRADLSVAKSGPAEASQDSDPLITYTVTAANAGPAAAQQAEIFDFLPPGATFSNATLPFTLLNEGRVVSLSLGDVAAGETLSALLATHPPPFSGEFSCETTLLNAARITSRTIDPLMDFNLAVATTSFRRVDREDSPELCDNGLDDDCDGVADCGEESCHCPPQVLSTSTSGGAPPPPPAVPPGPFGPNGPPASGPGAPRNQPARGFSCGPFSNPHGPPVTLPASCCDGSGGGGSGCHVPTDPNFKESTPSVNAYGYAYASAGQHLRYDIHYENIGDGDAHQVAILDPLDTDLDASTLELHDGGLFDPATRTVRWIDPLLPAHTARSVSFEVDIRADAPPGTHVRNVATVIFPDAVPPSRIDTNFTEHLIADPAFPVEARLKVFGCVAEGAGVWRPQVVNEGFGFAYDVTATILQPPAPVVVSDGAAGFGHPDDTAALHTVIPMAASSALDTVAFTTQTPGDPCGALAWRISYRDSSGQAITRDVQDQPDADHDAVADAGDNCPAIYNPTQADADGDGIGDACENRPPSCAALAAIPSRIWPPNHQWVSIALGGASDPDGDPVTLRVTTVRQDEPLNSGGDGCTSPDARIVSSGLQVRAERKGNGDGRVYHAKVVGWDPRGATCQGEVTICVPHDASDTSCGDQGPRYDSLHP